MDDKTNDGEPDVPILPDSVPVTMPELPLQYTISTDRQFKAISDPVRLRMLAVMRHQPATAKQLADRLHVSPGAIGHHMRVLEEAGLVQLVTRRLTRGIVANYYTRSGRIYSYDLPPELREGAPIDLHLLEEARDELAESLAHSGDEAALNAGLPRVRLSPERVAVYNKRIAALLRAMLEEPSDPNGEVYTFAFAFFLAPPYLQVQPTPNDQRTEGRDDGQTL